MSEKNSRRMSDLEFSTYPNKLNKHSQESRNAFHSKSLADIIAPVVDLRMTRPPESLRLKPLDKLDKSHGNSQFDKFERSRSAGYTGDENDHRHRQTPTLNVEERSQRMNAMVRNFCAPESGLLIDDINMKQFTIDSGEIVTNATVQELCTIRPTLTRLDLTDCKEVTDVGLWAIARHCTELKSLSLSGCHQITHIGLRSLSLRLLNLTELNMNYCQNLDDMALTVIASGCWHLEKIRLRGCQTITDTGVGKVAKASERLEFLDLNGCISVGEYGDHALKELGAFCGLLRELDLGGCKRVEDGGLRAVAQGCPKLEVLRLAGCDGITGKGFRSLIKYGRSLSSLHLTGSRHLTDDDMQPLIRSPLRDTLTDLDLSGCSRLSDRGVGALAEALGSRLSSFGIGKSNITDNAAWPLAHYCTRLRSIDMSFCPHITESTVTTLANGVTGLTTLKLNGNGDRIDARFLSSFNLEFAQMALQWLGFQPREGAYTAIEDAEVFQKRTASVEKIQCMVRRKLAYKRYWEKRRWWLLTCVIPRFQAHVRAYFQRKRYRLLLLELKRIRCAIKIQVTFRIFIDRRRYLETLRQRKLHAFLMRKASLIQAGYRGMLSRRRVRRIRNEILNRSLAEARLKVQKELAAIRIQTVFRITVAKKLVARLIEARDALIARAALEDRSVRPIQKLIRGRFGRKRFQARVDYLKLQELHWKCVRNIQRVLRGYNGRKLIAPMRDARELRIKNGKATIIQRVFRGYRARLLMAVHRAVNVWRILQRHAAVRIQKIIRGMIQRAKFRARLEADRLRLKELGAVLLIQRIFRGHKGKEKRDIRIARKKMAEIVAPLQKTLNDLKEEENKRDTALKRLQAIDEGSDLELEEIEIELEQCMNTTSRYTDNSRIMKGVQQRFLTKYLRVRLKELLDGEKEAQVERRKEIYERQRGLREVQRQIRETHRQLAPLTHGLIVAVKRERTVRIRNKVRRRDWASRRIQSIMRGALVRMAALDPYRFYWVECFDPEQSSKPYYYNTTTGETAWRMPAGFRYFCRR